MIAPAVTAVPDREMARDGFDASLVIANVPVGVPDVVGVNTTLNDLLAPAAKVNGKVIPLKLNPEPVTFACETVTADPPLLVTVSVKVWLLPTTTLPKVKLGALAASVPGVVPEPDNGTASDGFDASLVIASELFALPPALGVNTTLNDVLLPAFTVIGKVSPVTV